MIIFSFSKCFKIVFATSPILCNFFNFTCRNSSKSSFQLWQQRKKQQLKRQQPKRLQKRNNLLKLVLFFLFWSLFLISCWLFFAKLYFFWWFYLDHPSFGNFIPKIRVVLSSASENFLIMSQFSSIIFPTLSGTCFFQSDSLPNAES